MKKIFSLFILLTMFTTTAHAAEWQTVRFPNMPSYVFSLPSAFHSLYYGVAEDHKTVQHLRITPSQAEDMLKESNADILLYPDDFSYAISIARSKDIEGFSYSDYTLDEFNAYIEDLASELSVAYELRSTDYESYEMLEALAYETVHSRYALLPCLFFSEGEEYLMAQFANITDGYKTSIILMMPTSSYSDEGVNIALDIIDNLVIL